MIKWNANLPCEAVVFTVLHSALMLSTQTDEDLRKVSVTVRSKASHSASSRKVQMGAEAAKELNVNTSVHYINTFF